MTNLYPKNRAGFKVASLALVSCSLLVALLFALDPNSYAYKIVYWLGFAILLVGAGAVAYQVAASIDEKDASNGPSSEQSEANDNGPGSSDKGPGSHGTTLSR